MRFSAAAAASLLAVAHARINGIAVPSVIKPGSTFDAIILSSNYIQSVADVAISFGFDIGEGHPGNLGPQVESFFLGPSESNQLHNFTKRVTAPKSLAKGEGVVAANLMSLYGIVNFATLTFYNVSVTFGDKTSTDYKTSLQ